MSEPPNIPLEVAWSAFVYRAAALAGATTGLVALLAGVPVTVACVRGVLTLAAAVALGRVSQWLVVRVATAPAGTVPGEEPAEVESNSTPKATEMAGR